MKDLLKVGTRVVGIEGLGLDNWCITIQHRVFFKTWSQTYYGWEGNWADLSVHHRAPRMLTAMLDAALVAHKKERCLFRLVLATRQGVEIIRTDSEDDAHAILHTRLSHDLLSSFLYTPDARVAWFVHHNK